MQLIFIFSVLLISTSFNCFGSEGFGWAEEQEFYQRLRNNQMEAQQELSRSTDAAKKDVVTFLKTCNNFEPLDALNAQQIEHMKKIMAQPELPTKAIMAPYELSVGVPKDLNPYKNYREQAFLYAASMGLLKETQNIGKNCNVLAQPTDTSTLAEIARNLAHTRKQFLAGLDFSDLKDFDSGLRTGLLNQCTQLTGHLHYMVCLEDSIGKLIKMPRGAASLIALYAIEDTDYSEFSSSDSCSIQ